MKKYDLQILLIEITQKCNAACEQCGSKCGINSEEGLTKDEILSTMRDIKKNIGTDMMINITGGEPLMRKDLFEIMGAISKMGFDWGMVSNGVLINDEVIEKMKETNMKTISISLDGMEKTHEKLRKLPGSFNTIIKNIKKLKAANFLDNIQITFTSNKKNLFEIGNVYDLANEIGVDSFRTSFIDPIGRAENRKDLLLDSNEMQYLINFANTENMQGGVPVIWGCCHYLGDKLDNRKFNCFAGKTCASILYNGDIFVCPNVPREKYLIQGNIKKDSFSDVWKNRFEFFREEHKPKYCEHCRHWNDCKGDSLHTWDFKEDKPKFCYRDIFDANIREYRKYLDNKYGSYIITEIAPDDKRCKTVYIEPEAYKEIKTYFHMGTRHPSSMYEQQMGMVGFKVQNSYVIKYVFPSDIKRINQELSVFTHRTIAQAEKETAIIKSNFMCSDDVDDYIGDGLQFLGFIHSHPIQHELQYSIGDEKIHEMLIKRYGDYIGILVNPADDTIGAYYGKQIKQARLRIIDE